jgi:hypothetical protein
MVKFVYDNHLQYKEKSETTSIMKVFDHYYIMVHLMFSTMEVLIKNNISLDSHPIYS